MKKFVSLLLCAFVVMLTFSACGEVEMPTLTIADSTVTATAKAKDNEAKFNVQASKDGMYNFTLEKKNSVDWDFKFYILNENNESVTGNISIHSTEWVTRSVLLQKGNYTLVVYGDEVNKPIICSVDVVNYYEDNEIALSQNGDLTAPVVLGFNALNTEEKSVKFTLDGTQTRLSFSAFGTGTYYDSEQEYILKITDKNGKIAYYDSNDVIDDYTYYGNKTIDVTGVKGEFTAVIQAVDTCTVAVDIS